MKVGDLVTYKDGVLRDSEKLTGIVLSVRTGYRADRVKVFWNLLENSDDVEDWVQDLEVISESR